MKWDHQPPAFTKDDMALTSALWHDWYHDPEMDVCEDGLYRGDTCFHDACNEGRPCGSPSMCMMITDPTKQKLHPNGDDEGARAITRAQLLAECLVDVEAGYLGYKK